MLKRLQLTAGDRGEDVADGVEEEKLRRYGRLDQHDDAAGDDGKQSDDVHHSDPVQYDVAWPG